MLNEKLEQAKTQNRHSNARMILILSLVGTACLLLVVALSVMDFSGSQIKPEQEIAKATETLSEGERDALRELFKEKLQLFEGELEPKISTKKLADWNETKALEIHSLKEKSITSFAGGEYQKALGQMDSAITLAEDSLKAQQAEFDQAFLDAQTFFEQDQYDQAKLNIDRALAIFNDHEGAQHLAQQINKLPELLPLLEEVQIARSENNLEKEYSLLGQVLELDPNRTHLKPRMAELEGMIKDRLYQQHIQLAFAAIEKGMAQKARENYEMAARIYPDQEEVRLVKQKLLALESQLRFEAAIQQADQFIRKDQWQTAKVYFEKAAKENPAHKTVVQGLERANEILRLNKAFEGYMNNPYRMSVSSYKQKVEADLVLSETYGNYSFSLMNKANDLVQLVDKLKQKKDVFVISDNETFVQVRGVGKVGKTKGRSIKLTPGEYTFEGLRDGYRTKLIKVVIPYDQDGTQVKVICDEPI